MNDAAIIFPFSALVIQKLLEQQIAQHAARQFGIFGREDRFVQTRWQNHRAFLTFGAQFQLIVDAVQTRRQ